MLLSANSGRQPDRSVGRQDRHCERGRSPQAQIRCRSTRPWHQSSRSSDDRTLAEVDSQQSLRKMGCGIYSLGRQTTPGLFFLAGASEHPEASCWRASSPPAGPPPPGSKAANYPFFLARAELIGLRLRSEAGPGSSRTRTSCTSPRPAKGRKKLRAALHE